MLSRGKGWIIAGLILLLAAESVYVGRHLWLRYWGDRGITPETRGFRLALKLGCFTCHGAGAVVGMESPVGDVPAWDGGNWFMYTPREEHIRNWIVYGSQFGKEEDPEIRAEREKMNPSELYMPAYGDRLNERELNDLIAFYKAVSWFRQPDDPMVEKGREIAARAGCFHCHGPEGRLNNENPGSFKGYIPAWYGPDFRELVRNDEELRQWILDGVSERFRKNPGARLFLTRQKIRMPAYRGKLKEDELEAIMAYIHWINESGAQ